MPGKRKPKPANPIENLFADVASSLLNTFADALRPRPLPGGLGKIPRMPPLPQLERIECPNCHIVITAPLGAPISFCPRCGPLHRREPQAHPPSRRLEAAIFIAIHSGIPKDSILDNNDARQNAYRLAARKLHPDRGGSHDEFVKLQQAMKILEAD